MRHLIPVQLMTTVGVLTFAILLALYPTTQADVYVNMLWDETERDYKVKPLVTEGATFDRGFQNAYGREMGYDPGPPFIVQAPISATGSVSFESGGFDPTRPFVIYMQPGGNQEGRISAAGGVSFVGTDLDPIRVEGIFEIFSGGGYERHSFHWANTTFRCQYHDNTMNTVPFEVLGGSGVIENCYFPDYSPPFFNLLSIGDTNGENDISVTIRNCRFERLSFPNYSYPITVRDADEFTFEDCHFKDVDYWYDDGSALIDIRRCGIRSIKGITGNNDDQNKILLIDAEAVDSAFIRCSDDLPIIANDIHVPPGGALAIGKGSVLKFHTLGGLDNEGRLYIDSSVLTSWEDDEHGGDTDNKFQPDPILSNWIAKGSGIFIDSGATAEITRTLIRYPRSGIHSFGGLTLDSVTIEDSWYSGVTLRGAHGYDYEISNTTIERITGSDPYSAAIFYENRTGYHQSLSLTNVSLLNNEVDGIEVFYLGDNFTNIELKDCRIANNTGYGIIFPVDHGLESIEILHSVFVGNGYAAIRGLDNYGNGIPIRIDNNVLVGNGLNQYGEYPYGIHLSGGTAKIVGNTVINNGEIGILVGGLDDIEQCVIANNIMVGHTEYGLLKGDDGVPIVAGNSFWNNGNEFEELRYEGPGGRIYTVEDLQALGGDFATNVNLPPGLLPEITGQIDTLSFDRTSGLSKLVDQSASFPSGQDLAGRYVCPDTADPYWYLVWNISADTLIVLGDIRDHADTNSVYRILDYHLSEASQLIDAGFTPQTQEMFDIDEDARILDGDENGSMMVDIGADEFNGEADNSPVRVLQPSSDKWVVAYGTFNIEWRVPDSVASVDIDYNTNYNPDQPDVGWHTIASGTDATSNYYTWTIPEYKTTAECYVRVTSTAHPSLFDLSQPFKIKHLGLTRMRNDLLVDYAHPSDGWQFANEEANMWPASVWPDYFNAPNPYTGLPYPEEFHNLEAANWDYPSWPTFVEAFGADACYFNYWPTPQYRPSALFRWAAIKEAWGGSCFGLAMTALMAFQDATAFAARPEIGPFTNLQNVTMTDLRRGLINRYYTYQYGQKNDDHCITAETKTPNEILAEVRSMFCELEASSAISAITICDTSTVNNQGCHAVTPYSLHRFPSGAWALRVYDSNEPTLSLDIHFDTVTNSWEYLELGWAGDKECYLEDPLSNYTGLAEMSQSAREAPPVATATQASGYLEAYWSDGDSIRFELGIGAIGQYGDSAFNDVPGARPIRPKAGAGDPIGYLLPDGDWSCQLAGSGEDYAHLTIFNDDVIMAYRRDSVGANDVEQVDIRGGDGMHLDNPDGAVRTCDLDFVIVQPDREQHLALGDLQLPAADSVALELTPTNGLRLANFGVASSYDLVIRDLSGPEMKEFIHFDIAVGANSEQHLVPNWNNVSEAQLMVIVDDGIDGVVDDTLYLSNGSPLDVEDDHGSLLPYRFELSQNYPNPFNPVTTIEYSLPRRSSVKIDVFNLLGQKVRTLVDREESAGTYSIAWDGTSSTGEAVSTGIYFYRFQADDHVETRKMLLLK